MEAARRYFSVTDYRLHFRFRTADFREYKQEPKKEQRMDFEMLATRYKDELLNNVLPFWLEHSLDRERGGYFTCLERDGSVFDTDKFIWLQGREVWMFSMLYNNVEKKKSGWKRRFMAVSS